MKTITFKNGKTLEVPQELINVLFSKQFGQAQNTFEKFLFNKDSTNIDVVINVNEIAFIS